MEAYRDQYATIFNNGRGVVVLAVSVDADTTHAGWARDSDFPFLFGSDTAGVVGRLYDAHDVQRKTDNRALFVIGPDRRIAYSVKAFRVLVPSAYAELAAVVDRLAPVPEAADTAAAKPVKP